MSSYDVAIIDYGVGNLLSVKRGFEHCDASVLITSDPKEIISAKRVVLPGVGAFNTAMSSLARLGLVDAICKVADLQIPLLGICLGMQLLLQESEEFGVSSGLGLIAGRVIQMPNISLSGENQKIPSIGWHPINPSNEISDWRNTILCDNACGDSVYFIHSFMAIPLKDEHCIAQYSFGGHKIAAVIGSDNIVGCQFHPEKSGEVGLKILRRFISL